MPYRDMLIAVPNQNKFNIAALRRSDCCVHAGGSEGKFAIAQTASAHAIQRTESSSASCASMLGIHDVSCGTPSRVRRGVGREQRLLKNSSKVLCMCNSATIGSGTRDCQGHPVTRGHVSVTTSR